MKKKMLEILLDEDGKISVSSETNPFAGADLNSAAYLQKFQTIIDELVKRLFLSYKKGNALSQIVKALSIADICADPQPYECIEQLWYTMMMSYLPKREKTFRKMKESYGVKVKVKEPIQMSPFLMGLDKPQS